MTDAPGRQPTEEEMQAAYEAEIKRLRVEDVLVQTVISLLNLGGRKAGLAPGTEEERDLGQLRAAIDGARVLLPLLEAELGPDAGQIREALSQLQMAYVQLGGGEGGTPPGPGGGEGAAPPQPGGGTPGGSAEAPPAPAPAAPAAPPPSRLWVPGQ
jgi:hypothetical protein